MPRVNLNKKKYLMRDFCEWIRGKMLHKYTESDVAKVLGISQQGFSKKLKNCTFNFDDIVTLLDFFQATDEEIVRLIRL